MRGADLSGGGGVKHRQRGCGNTERTGQGSVEESDTLTSAIPLKQVPKNSGTR